MGVLKSMVHRHNFTYAFKFIREGKSIEFETDFSNVMNGFEWHKLISSEFGFNRTAFTLEGDIYFGQVIDDIYYLEIHFKKSHYYKKALPTRYKKFEQVLIRDVDKNNSIYNRIFPF